MFAIIRSVEASGRAVVAISIVLIAQFSLLGLSDFHPTAHFGMLCAVGLFAGHCLNCRCARLAPAAPAFTAPSA